MIINQPDIDYIGNIFVVMLVWSKSTLMKGHRSYSLKKDLRHFITWTL